MKKNLLLLANALKQCKTNQLFRIMKFAFLFLFLLIIQAHAGTIKSPHSFWEPAYSVRMLKIHIRRMPGLVLTRTILS